MVKISVIIPVYNVEKYICRCLDSIINQTLREIEIIVVNDGSTDRSRMILEKYKEIDERIILINKENGGQSSARNEGMKIAKGKYIGFIDSDDWASLDMYEKLYEAMEEDIDLAVCGRELFNGAYEKIGEVKIKDQIIEIKKIEDYIVDSFLYRQTVLCCNKLYKKSVLRENNIFFEDVDKVGSEDALFNYCYILNIKKVREISEGIYNGYEREGSTTRKYKKGCMNRTANFIENIYRYSKKYEKEEIGNNVASIFLIFFQQWNYNYIKTFGKENIRKILKEEHEKTFRNNFFRKAEKNFIFDKNIKGYIERLGYSQRGILFFKVYMFFSYCGFNTIAATVRKKG